MKWSVKKSAPCFSRVPRAGGFLGSGPDPKSQTQDILSLSYSGIYPAHSQLTALGQANSWQYGETPGHVFLEWLPKARAPGRCLWKGGFTFVLLMWAAKLLTLPLTCFDEQDPRAICTEETK